MSAWLSQHKNSEHLLAVAAAEAEAREAAISEPVAADAQLRQLEALEAEARS